MIMYIHWYLCVWRLSSFARPTEWYIIANLQLHHHRHHHHYYYYYHYIMSVQDARQGQGFCPSTKVDSLLGIGSFSPEDRVFRGTDNSINFRSLTMRCIWNVYSRWWGTSIRIYTLCILSPCIAWGELEISWTKSKKKKFNRERIERWQWKWFATRSRQFPTMQLLLILTLASSQLWGLLSSLEPGAPRRFKIGPHY